MKALVEPIYDGRFPECPGQNESDGISESGGPIEELDRKRRILSKGRIADNEAISRRCKWFPRQVVSTNYLGGTGV
jgi:hypothetical protein